MYFCYIMKLGMTENEIEFQTPASTNYAADIAQNSTIVEEGPMICPVCSSIMEQCHLDVFTKLFQCTSHICEYPYADKYTVYSSDEDNDCYGMRSTCIPRKRYTRSSKSIATGTGCTSTLGTHSNLSASEWSDMNRANQAYDSDDNLPPSKLMTKKSTQRQIEKRVKKQEDEQHIKQNVEKIKECNKMLFDSRGESGIIRNEKWIKNLSSLQSSSGMRLVKDHELQKLKSTQDNIYHGELKIDIASKQDAMSSIVIAIGGVTNVSETLQNIKV